MMKNKIIVGLISWVLLFVNAEVLAASKCATGISVAPSGPFTFCKGATATTLTATITTSSGSAQSITYVWYSNTINSTVGGTQVQTTSTTTATTTSTFTPSTSSSGTLYYYCVVTNNATCGSTSFTTATVQVTVNDLPAAPTGTGGSRCGTGTVNISATPGAGETIDWYAASSGGTALLSNSTTFTTPSISVTTTYYAEARNTTTGCVSATRTAVVATINGLPSAPTGTGGSRCGTGTVDISATPASGEAIDWYAAASGGSALLSGSTTFTTPSISSTTTYYAEARDISCGGAVSASRTAVVATVNSVPTLSSVSQAAAVCSGTNATINLTGLLASTTQTVYYNINGGSTSSTSVTSNGSGAASFTVAVTGSNNGQPLTVTSISTSANSGCSPTFSIGTTLAVNAAPTISSQPSTTNQNYCKSSSATPLSVTASAGGGTINSYSWYSNTTNSNSGGTFIITHSTSATTDSYTPSTAATGTLYYYCIVANTNGCSVTTNTSGQIVVTTGTTISSQPSTATQTICHGGTSTALSIAATGGSTYQWYSNATNSNVGGTLISGATSASFTPPTTTDGTLYYYCVASKSGCSATSNVSGAIIINPTSVAGSVSGATSVCTGTNSTILTLSGNTGTIQWQSSPNNITFSNIGGATSSTYTATNLSSTTYYRAVVTSGVCSSVATSSVTITVNPTSVAGSISGAAPVCTGSNNTTLTLSGNTGTIQWQSSPDNSVFSDIGGATSSTYSATNLSSTTYYRAVVTSGVCTSAITSSVTITVDPPSVAGSISGGDVSVCGGTNSTPLTLSGNTGTIQWQSSPDNFSYSDIGGATSSTYTATDLSSTTYYLVVVTSGACPPVATASVTITAIPVGTTVWNGSSTVWGAAGNWSCGLPSTSLDVSIPAGLANYPVIPAGTTVTAKNLTIDLNASLSLSDNTSTLQVAGDFTNNGTFTSNGGTVEFNGTIDQAISGSPATTFDKINVTNGSGTVSVESDQNLTGVLTLSANSTFDADGSGGTSIFTLISTSDIPTADAGIATLPSGASVTGNLTVQRFMSRIGSSTYNYHVWRDISPPVNGATVGDLQLSIPVTWSNPSYSSVIVVTPPDTQPVDYSASSIKIYDEPTNKWQDFLTAASDNTVPFVSGKGYSVFIFGAESENANGNDLWSLTGSLNVGPFPIPLSFTSSTTGWNLVGNPFPSAIDWLLIRGNSATSGFHSNTGGSYTNIQPTIYIENYSQGALIWSSYNSATGATSNSGSQYIATGQGFYVRASASSPTLTLFEEAKAAGTSTRFFRKEAPSNILNVALTSPTNQRDETVIYFTNDATDEFDEDYDAEKLLNKNYINLSSLSPALDKYVINAMPLPDQQKRVPLDVSDVSSGEYSLSFNQISSLPASLRLQLEDKFENTVTDLRENPVYTFKINKENSTSFGSGRFNLILGGDQVSSTLGINAYPNPVSGVITIEAMGEKPASGRIYNSLGFDLSSLEFTNTGHKQSAQFDFKKESSGIYFVRVEQGDKVSIIRIVKD